MTDIVTASPLTFAKPVYILKNDVVTYNWIGQGLQSGPTLAFSLCLPDFKTKTSVGFPTKKIRGRFLFVRKVKKRA